ncbi:hypothetical protein GCM10023338_12700 [Wohlfahrtiimonas larvae]|uniref:DUF4390 domain-containing protein n=2 Tax=Wohlfahrtiimonas larvae TaxID=1157986 RepID=A0ABP9MRG6_9GAMM
MSFAEDFSISSVYVKNGNQQDTYKLSIEATIKMSNEQIEILQNGISLTFSYTFVVEEKVGLVWLEGDNKQTIYDYTISYNALTQQYVVESHKKRRYENFPTLSLALAYIAEPKNMSIKIIDREPNRAYRGGVRLKLDINELPTPLRIPAYLSKEWNLDTGWKYWEFSPW